ncbi:NAD(P)/FAD-dependent oxidoreductase [Eilatimonas milleporae]|uniref:NAD(P)/FAD-dependent oxidoreductase n=1 Tax=Eilatimonas milleporae TaxID=911205 RepID=UPI001B86D243|nr:FAD-dependent oxidoreductase [Eilatimonas milleporae]
MTHPKYRIAIVGSGIAGLSAAWLLSRHHEVHLFEADTRLGGHSNTVTVMTAAGPLAIDTGFIVFNDRTYPNLVPLFDTLGVTSVKSDMSFSVSSGGGAFEYAGSDIHGLMAQKRNLVRPRFWSMIRDLMRFYREAAEDGRHPSAMQQRLGAYLTEKGYGKAFREDHILPMAAAIWSTGDARIDDFPLAALTRFFDHHGLLNLSDRPQWRTLVGGAKTYVAEMAKPLGRRVHLNHAVRSIARGPGTVRLTTQDGIADDFDHVVIAAHADQALAMLDDPTEDERNLLGAFQYSRNRAVLHSDPALMPRRKAAWASWNALREKDGADAPEKVCVSYWMNRLQPIGRQQDFFVTLNPVHEPDAVHYETQYTHPLFDSRAMMAQRELWSLQGGRRTWFCGAHFGYGFHEDGVQSGLAVAEAIGGVTRPWRVPDENGRVMALAEANTPLRRAAE